VLRHALAGAAVVGLVLPTHGVSATKQGQQKAKQAKAQAQQAKAQAQQAAAAIPPPKLTESPSSGFPDKAYLLTLPAVKALSASQVSVTENGSPVVGMAVAPPGGSKSGAILLIDASNSMKGAPIQNAT